MEVSGSGKAGKEERNGRGVEAEGQRKGSEMGGRGRGKWAGEGERNGRGGEAEGQRKRSGMEGEGRVGRGRERNGRGGESRQGKG
jgi:hypothetical protein